MEFSLVSKYGADTVDVSRDYDGDIKFSPDGGTVYTDDAGARAFARKILALVGDGADESAVKVGERVEITKYRKYDDAYVGRTGVVTEVDDDDIPYLVHVDGYGGVWAREVRKVTPTAAPVSTSRAALLEEARKAAGPGATPGDVLNYAKFLAE
ncbi:hypothetical protein [Streptomyces sp. NPDC002952]|uniref:hypothetical protein n=1 Tax=Streptomyces sp. NPDC002952 TaxID=3364673 RepID=UPI003699D186